METCEIYQKFYELEGLNLEVYALIDTLERALKYDEYESCQDTNDLYLVKIIKEKFEKITIIVEDIEFKQVIPSV